MAVTWADVALAATLLLALPLSKTIEGLRKRDRPLRPGASRYWRGVGLAGILMTWLAIDWWREGRSLSVIGLAWPPSSAGWVGLLLAALVLGGLALAVTLQLHSGRRRSELAEPDLLPRTPGEAAVFVIFCLVACSGWEVLYRGYLLWFLAPSIGVAGSVMVAAAAYGVLHGVNDWRRFAASLVAALLFTTAYALTGSLWWLILMHVGLPLVGMAQSRGRAAKAEKQDALPA